MKDLTYFIIFIQISGFSLNISCTSFYSILPGAFLVVRMVNNLPAMQEIPALQVRSLGWEDPLGKEMDTHSSILAWKIP